MGVNGGGFTGIDVDVILEKYYVYCKYKATKNMNAPRP